MRGISNSIMTPLYQALCVKGGGSKVRQEQFQWNTFNGTLSVEHVQCNIFSGKLSVEHFQPNIFYAAPRIRCTVLQGRPITPGQQCVICPRKGGKVEYVNSCIRELFIIFYITRPSR